MGVQPATCDWSVMNDWSAIGSIGDPIGVQPATSMLKSREQSSVSCMGWVHRMGPSGDRLRQVASRNT